MTRKDLHQLTAQLKPGDRLTVRKVNPMPLRRTAAAMCQTGVYVGRTHNHLLMVSESGGTLSFLYNTIQEVTVR